MSRLALHLLGPPRIERDGVSIVVDTRKAVALLAYLAVTGESQRRASLVNLLWPDSDSTHGRAVLRRTLYALRKALDGPWLNVSRDEIGLKHHADVWVDVAQFHQHLSDCETHGHAPSQVCPACLAPLTAAVSLARGDFLAGFGLRDSINFDDWQFFQGEGLRRELAGALERLVRWHSAQREFEAATGYARRWLALDPLNEQIHCELMRLYTWAGQRSAALRQYQDCVRTLEDQLGVPPQEATRGLCTAIERGRVPSPPPPAACHSDLPPGPPSFLEGEEELERAVFVARQEQLVALHGHLEAALDGRAGIVFVTGDAGSGKTALIQEFALQAQATRPALVVAGGHGNAHTGLGDPYLPFREILGLLSGDVEAQWAAGAMSGEQARRLWHLLPLTAQALIETGPDLVDSFVPGATLVDRASRMAPIGSDWLAELKALVTRQATSRGSSGVHQTALFEQYTQVLRALASHKPLLLTLDDLQWVDGGSANLLFHLGRRIGGSRILILGAYRPAEVAQGRAVPPRMGDIGGTGGDQAEAWGRHPLEPVVNELKRALGDIEVDLDQAEGRLFVDAFLDSEPNCLGEDFRQTLYQHTRGYPLFTVELMRGMQVRGDLIRDGWGRWMEGSALNWEMLPARVEAVIAERLGQLPARLLELLTVASVEGETFTAEVVAEVAAVDEAETVRCLSGSLDRRYRLVAARGMLRHADQRLSRYRFRHILFQRYLASRLDRVQRAHLHEAVGTALETLYGVGTEKGAAVEAPAAQLAWHFEEAGIVEKAVAYLCQAGERARQLYANEQAIAYFQRALVLLQECRQPEGQTKRQQGLTSRLHEHLGDVLEWTGEHERAAAAYGDALKLVPEADLIRQSQLHRKVGNVWRLQSRHVQALRAYDRASSALGEAVTGLPSEWWQEWVQVRLERMWLHYWLGQWREMSKMSKIRSSVEQHGTPSQSISFFLCLAGMNNRRDRYVVSEETLDFCHIAVAIALESEDVGEIAWARFVLGFSQLWHGDLDDAEKQIQAALALAEQTGDVVHKSRCLTYLTILHRKLCQVEEARDYVRRSQVVAEEAQMLEYLGTAQANLAWVAWREGELMQAQASGEAALKTWHGLPSGHSSCAFQWTALWPLVAVAAARDKTSETCELLRGLLEPTQQRLPQELATVVEDALRAYEVGNEQSTRNRLDEALRVAEELAFL